MYNLQTFVDDFARCVERVDARCPVAVNARSKQRFQAGIGPHSESATIRLVVSELKVFAPERYRGWLKTNVSYPQASRQKCDLCIGSDTGWEWAIEAKMLRFFGDNGKRNDNILMHILSPYPEHRSALTDCVKLAKSNLGKRKAVLIYGYDHENWTLDPAIEAFEALARAEVELSRRCTASFDSLVHPVHQRGRVFAWEVT